MPRSALLRWMRAAAFSPIRGEPWAVEHSTTSAIWASGEVSELVTAIDKENNRRTAKARR